MPSPSFMETVQYASLLHPTMIRIAFESMQGVKSFAGRSTPHRAIPAKAGIQLDKLGKGGEAPFSTFQRPIRELALPRTVIGRHEWGEQRSLHGYPVIPAKAGIQLKKSEKRGGAPFFSFQRPIRELALAPTGVGRCQKESRRHSSLLPGSQQSWCARRTLHCDPAIPAKAGIQSNNFEKGGEAPFFSFSKRS